MARSVKTPIQQALRGTDAPGGPASAPASVALLVLLAAISLRIWTVAVLGRDPRVSEPLLDGDYYLRLARDLAGSGSWPPGPFFMTPLYPFLLSVLFRIAPPGVGSIQVFQSVLGLGTLGLLVLTARRESGRGAGWALAALYVLSAPILCMESLVLTESLLLFLVAAALWAWPRPDPRTGPGPAGRAEGGIRIIGPGARDLLFGILCGLLSIGRGTFLLLPVGAGLSLWFSSRARDPGKAGAVGRRAALIGAGVLIALLPVAARQTATTGRPRFTTMNGGMNLYIGNNPVARGMYSQPPEIDLSADITATRSASILAGRPLTLAESSSFWTRRALVFFREQPGRAAWLWGRKALLYLSPREIPQIETFDVLRQRTFPLRVAFVDFAWILPLAVFGAAVSIRRRRLSSIVPLLLVVAIGWITTVVFFATGRYRIPFLAGFLGLAAIGAVEVLAMVRARRFGAVALLLPVVAAGQFLLPSYPVAKALAYDAWQLGTRLESRGDRAGALAEYREAIRLWPDSGEAWHGAGVALVELNRLPEAADAYREALIRLPGSAPTHYNLGAVRGRMGDDAGALAEFREAVRIDPLDPRYRADLGVALARTGRTDEALREFREALRIRPGFAPALRGLDALGARP